MLAAGGIAAALDQNPETAASAAQNEALNNSEQVHTATPRTFGGSALTAACGNGSQPCNTQLPGSMLQAQGDNAQLALGTVSPNYPTLNFGVLSASAGGVINLADGTKYLAIGVGQSNPSAVSWTLGSSATLGWVLGGARSSSNQLFPEWRWQSSVRVHPDPLSVQRGWCGNACLRWRNSDRIRDRITGWKVIRDCALESFDSCGYWCQIGGGNAGSRRRAIARAMETDE